MLSYISLHPDGWQENSYIALCGVGSAPIQRFLEEVPQLEEIVAGLAGSIRKLEECTPPVLPVA